MTCNNNNKKAKHINNSKSLGQKLFNNRREQKLPKEWAKADPSLLGLTHKELIKSATHHKRGDCNRAMSIFKALILMLQDVIQKSVMALTGTNLKNKRHGDVGFFCSLTLLGKNNPNCTEAGRCFGVLYTIYKKTVQETGLSKAKTKKISQQPLSSILAPWPP